MAADEIEVEDPRGVMVRAPGTYEME